MMGYMAEDRPSDRDGVNLYEGDWVVVEEQMLKVEGEVVEAVEGSEVVTVRVGVRHIAQRSENCQLHEEGRPEVRQMDSDE